MAMAMSMAMAGCGSKMGYAMAWNLIKTLKPSSNLSEASVEEELLAAKSSLPTLLNGSCRDTSKKSPKVLINEVPPIKVEGRIVACEGDNNPALGHPIKFICLDLDIWAICNYSGLRYVQNHGHHRN